MGSTSQYGNSNVGSRTSPPDPVTLPKVSADPKYTKTCCEATLEPFLASAKNKNGDTVYVTAYECPKCKKITT
jgi:hypothetical protein